MDLALQKRDVKKIIRKLNQCRVYLEVLTLSNITNLQGTYNEAECFAYDKTGKVTNIIEMRAKFLKANKPTCYYWTVFLDSLTNHNSRRLWNLSGKWTVQASEIRRKYKMHRDREHIYSININGFSKHNLANEDAIKIKIFQIMFSLA